MLLNTSSTSTRIKLSRFKLRLELPLFLLFALAIHTTRKSIYDAFRLLQVNRMICSLLTEHCKVAKLIEQLTFRTKDIHKSLSIASSLLEEPLSSYLKGYIYTLYTIGSTLDYNEKWIVNSIENLEIVIKEKLNFTATLIEVLIIAATLLALGVTLLGIVNGSVMILLLPIFLLATLILTYHIRIGLSELQISTRSRFTSALIETFILLTTLYFFLTQSSNMTTMSLALLALITSISYIYLYFNRIIELRALGDLIYKFSEQARVLGHIKSIETRDLTVDKKSSRLSKYIAYAVKTGRLLQEDKSKVSMITAFTAYVLANMMRSGTYIARVLDKMADFFKKLYELEHCIIARFVVYELVMTMGGLVNGLAIKALFSLSTSFDDIGIVPQFFANIDVVTVYAILLLALWLGSYAIATMLLDVPISIATPLTFLVYTVLLKMDVVLLPFHLSLTS